MSSGQWGLDQPEDQVQRLNQFRERHRDVLITAPPVTASLVNPGPWVAERFGEELARNTYLMYFLDDLDALGLPEVLCSQS